MKKKFPRLFVHFAVYMFCSTPSFAQEIICEGELELLKNAQDKISVEKVKLNKDGSYTLYAFSQLQQPGGGDEAGYTPALIVYHLNEQLQLRKKESISYHPANPSATLKKPGTVDFMKEKEKSFQEMQQLYPEFYQSAKKEENYFYTPGYLMGKPVVVRSGIHFEYDILSNSFTEIVNQKSIPLETPLYENGSVFIHDEIKINPQAALISMVLSNHQAGQNAGQMLFLNQTLVSCNLEGKQLSRYHLAFEYPSEVRFHQFVQDQEGKNKGVVYVFGPARRFGFKMTDPDPHNYQLVMMDTRGRLIVDHKFRYGVGGGASEPFYAAAHDEQIWMLGKGQGANPDFHLFVFDSTGLKSATLIDPEMLYSKTTGDYDLSIKKDYYSSFHPKGFTVQEDGGVLVYGEHRSTAVNAKVNPSTGEKISAVYEYPSYTFLQFDKDGGFLRNFVVGKKDGGDVLKSSEIKHLNSGAGKVHFLLTEALEKKQALHNYQKFYTGNKGVKINKNYVGNVESSTLLSLDLAAGNVEALSMEDDLININGQGHYIFNPVKKELLLLGKAGDGESPVRILFKKVKL